LKGEILVRIAAGAAMEYFYIYLVFYHYKIIAQKCARGGKV
jgi:hypothetical protein